MKSIFDITVSAFRNVEGVTPKDVKLSAPLTSDKYRDKVEMIRRLNDEHDQKLIKKTLFAFTPSGRFSYRNKENLIEHSGFLAFDIDFQDNQHITNFSELKDQLKNIQNIAYCGLSVRGMGFWGLVRIPKSTPEEHELRFEALRQDFERFGIVLDPSGSDVCRLRIYSWDPDGYFNHNATEYTKIHKPQPKTAPTYNKPTSGDNRWKVEALISGLQGIDITSDYKSWLKIGFALAQEFGEAGRQYFHEISRFHPKYSPQETDSQFNHCLNPKYARVTIATLFDIALQHGIRFMDNASALKPMTTEELQKLAAEAIGPNNHTTSTELLQKMNSKELNILINSGFIKEAHPLKDCYFLTDSTPF